MNLLVDLPEIYYQFRETTGINIDDSSGNNHHAKIHRTSFTLGQPSLISGLDSDIINDIGNNKSFQFNNGNNSWIQGPSTTLGTDWEIEIWVKPTTVDSTQRVVVGSRFDGSAVNSQFLIDITSGNRLNFHGFSGSTESIIVGPPIVANSKYYTVVTCQANICSFWVNGVFHGTVTLAGNINNPGSPIMLGTNGSVLSNFFDGYIDEFTVYHHVAHIDTETVNARLQAGLNSGISGAASYLHNCYNVVSGEKRVAFPWAVIDAIDTSGNKI